MVKLAILTNQLEQIGWTEACQVSVPLSIGEHRFAKGNDKLFNRLGERSTTAAEKLRNFSLTRNVLNTAVLMKTMG